MLPTRKAKKVGGARSYGKIYSIVRTYPRWPVAGLLVALFLNLSEHVGGWWMGSGKKGRKENESLFFEARFLEKTENCPPSAHPPLPKL